MCVTNTETLAVLDQIDAMLMPRGGFKLMPNRRIGCSVLGKLSRVLTACMYVSLKVDLW